MDTTPDRPGARLEAALSAVAVIGTLFLPLHAVGTQFCISSVCPEPTTGEILLSQAVAAAVVLLVGVSLLLAMRRGAGWSWLWHAPFAMVAAASVLLFTLGVDRMPESAPVPRNPDYVPCYSGSGDCVGG